MQRSCTTASPHGTSPARRHPYAAYAANTLRVSSVANVLIAAAMCEPPGGHVGAHQRQTRRQRAQHRGLRRNCANRNNQRETQRQQLNEMKGQP
ncbi:hypothetical protein BPORC_1896 [Bifidobacterium porcinum]|nr:hypothetical protein BPORC_1896 [Bifidobacterium porcinum]